MKKTMSCLGLTSVVAATFAATNIVPAVSAPINLPMTQTVHPSEITFVGWHGGGWRGGGWHGGGWRGGGYYGGWYPGYDGYYGGDELWIAGGALLLGALIGSAIANSAYHGDYYYHEDRRPQRYRHRYYSQKYSYTPYVADRADPYLGWQRGLDH